MMFYRMFSDKAGDKRFCAGEEQYRLTFAMNH